MKDMLTRLDRRFDERSRPALAAGDMPADMETPALEKAARAVLHSIAIRACGGESCVALQRFARFSARLLSAGGA